MRKIPIGLITIFLSCMTTFGAEYFASPAGSGSRCSFASPCSLQTALNNQANMGVGDTLYLRGGTYYGRWTSNLDGGTVRSYCAKFGPCRPDDPEWATLDGNYTATIANPISAFDTRLILRGTFAPQLGAVLAIDNEEVYLKAGSFPVYEIVRGWGGSRPAAHSAGAKFHLRGNQLAVNGSNTIYRDFEITDSNPIREYFIAGYGGYLRGGTGVFNFCTDCKFINLVVHDNANGFFDSETAKRTEVYGCIVFNNGHVSNDRPHGHNFYLQNESGGTKYIKDVISLNAYALGLKVYGASKGHANQFSIEGYVGFNNGSPGYYPGNPTRMTKRRYGNLEVGSDAHASSDISIANVYLYHAAGNIIEFPGLHLGRIAGNTRLSVTDSMVVEPGDLLIVDRWTDITVTGNTFIMNENGGLPFLARAISPAGRVVWDKNTYYDLSRAKNCSGGSFKAPFNIKGMTGACGTSMRWNDWRSTSGYDANSVYHESPPTRQVVIVRENAYEPGRNHVIVYNFAGSSSFQFTPRGLAQGRTYTIYDAQNWGTVYQSGTYSGGAITVDLTSSAPVRPPTGSSYTPPTTQPRFGVFVLIPGRTNQQP